ncbi:hypothetical protein RB195_008006 [Necator americanus]|uniref:Uncharacterized protein n=1 Tax=Necator americanus TaxID=51031 RepID=A0ABR1C141_NECAM
MTTLFWECLNLRRIKYDHGGDRWREKDPVIRRIRTCALRRGLRPERSALDHSARMTTLFWECLNLRRIKYDHGGDRWREKDPVIRRIRTCALRRGLRPERSALDHSARMTLLVLRQLNLRRIKYDHGGDRWREKDPVIRRIRTCALRRGLRPERSALDHSARMTTLFWVVLEPQKD